VLALADLSVCSRIASPLKTSLAPAAHEDAGVKVRVHFMAPLMLARLLGRAPRPLPASVGRASESAGSRARYLHQADLLVQVSGFRVRRLDLPIREAGHLIEMTVHLLGRERGRLPVRRQGWDDVVVLRASKQGSRSRWLLARHLGASRERSGGLDPCCHFKRLILYI
jgi:hypothetical protein